MAFHINTDRIAKQANRWYKSARRDLERTYDTVIVKSDNNSWAAVATGAALVAGLAIGGFYVFWRKTRDAEALAHTSYENWTREQLYERAREEEIDGRSTMNKSELIEALRSEVSSN